MATIKNAASSSSSSAYTNSISVSPASYTLSAGTLSNSLSDLYYIKNTYDISYFVSSIFSCDDVSETTLRSLIIDLKAANKMDDSYYDTLLRNRTLSEKFLSDFYDKFDKAVMYQYQTLSLDFIKKHLDDVLNVKDTCRSVCLYQNLTEEFIELISDSAIWDAIAANKHIKFTVSFLLKYIDKFNDEALKELCKNDSINTGVFNALLEALPEEIRYRLDWEAISWHKDLTEENILNNLDFIDFNSLLLATRKFKDDVITCFRKVKFGI